MARHQIPGTRDYGNRTAFHDLGHQQKSPTGTELDMSDLQAPTKTADNQRLSAPVELLRTASAWLVSNDDDRQARCHSAFSAIFDGIAGQTGASDNLIDGQLVARKYIRRILAYRIMVITLLGSCLMCEQERLTTLVNFRPELHGFHGQFSTCVNRQPPSGTGEFVFAQGAIDGVLY